MKHCIRKILPLLCLLLLLTGVSAMAATVTPGQVTNLKATSSETKIKLSWKKASKAKGYCIYRVNQTTGAATLLKKTTKTSYTLKGSYNVTYYFKVCAYSKTKTTGEFSSIVSVTPKASAPKTPSNFKMKSRGDKNVVLTWSKVRKASGYIIEQYESTSKTWKTVKTLSSGTKTVTIGGLTAGTEYQFRIRSYKNAGSSKVYSSPSSTVTVTAVSLSDSVKAIRGAYYRVRVRRNVTAKNLTTGKSFTLKKGTTLSVTAKKGSTVTGYLSNGNRIRVSRSALSYTGLDSSSKNDYSKSVKEEYVNSKGFSSRTKYLIWISHYKLKVNVFYGSQGHWTLVKVFPCVVGKWSTRTPGGMHRILRSIANGLYGGPYMYFSVGTGSSSNPNGAAFHNQVDSTMSKAASHGCCRLRLSDLRWLYNHCKVGTAVWSY